MKLVLLLISSLFLVGCGAQQLEVNSIYFCETASDCISTCGVGCVNKEWVETYEDICVNIRAWNCSCVENECYSDGNPSGKLYD